MNYVENISLRLDVEGKYIVDNVNFRNTFFKEFKQLFEEGYIDWKFPKVDADSIGYVRYSNYLPMEKVEQHIMRLREFYDVYYYEGTFNFETKIFEGKKYDVLIKELDYDPLKRAIIEMDFQALVSGEKVHSVAEIVLHNKEKVMEGVLEQMLEEISYKALPEDLVDKIDIDCGDLRLGDSIKVSDLDLAKNKNVDIQTHLDATIVSVIASHNDTEDEDADEDGVAAEA